VTIRFFLTHEEEVKFERVDVIHSVGLHIIKFSAYFISSLH
jgi:hypothetical protein